MKGHLSKLKSFFSSNYNISPPVNEPIIPRVKNMLILGCKLWWSFTLKKQNIVEIIKLKHRWSDRINQRWKVTLHLFRYEGIEKYPNFKEIGLNQGEVVDGETIILYEPQFVHYKSINGRY